MMSTFKYGGKEYEVSSAAADEESVYIRLPDERLLGVGKWFESYPPIPEILGVVTEPDDRPIYLAWEA